MDRFVTQAQAQHALRRHALALLAIALVCEEAVQSAVATAFTEKRRPRYRRKMHGYWTATMWSEAARIWARTLPLHVVTVHEPYEWTELIVNRCLHVRIEREHRGPRKSTRRIRRHHQLPDAMLPIPLGPKATVTNIDLSLRYSQSTGQVTGMAVTAANGHGALWAPYMISAAEGRRLLRSWRLRSHTMPWLEDLDHLAALTVMAPAVAAPTSRTRPVRLGGTHSGPPGATFTKRSASKKPSAGKDEGDAGNA